MRRPTILTALIPLAIRSLIASLILGSMWVEAAKGKNTPELVVYSARKEQMIQPVLDAYTQEKGVKFKLLTDDAGPLIERIKAEGDKASADVFFAVDAGNLWFAAQQGLLLKLDSKILNERIPSALKDPDNRWFGFSLRARTMFFNPKKVKLSELSTYEALADTRWKKRLCLRSSNKVYNQSLVATLIKQHGEKATEAIVKGWVANLATEPFSDDTKLLEAIAAGQCDVGIANSYYFGRLLKKDPALNVSLFWANANDRGVHVNISGAGVVKNSKNKKAAQDFLEWLALAKAQSLFAQINLEFPASSDVDIDPVVKAWGDYKQDSVNLSVAGELQAQAVMLMDRAGYK